MKTETVDAIESYFALLSPSKKEELRTLYHLILEEMRNPPISFFDGRNEEGKIIANPTIGFGETTLHYSNGKSRNTFRIGICATTSGISIHILGLKNKNFLRDHFANRLGKAKLTGYCISFKKLNELDLEELRSFIRLIRNTE
jgi:hypothetical protein